METFSILVNHNCEKITKDHVLVEHFGRKRGWHEKITSRCSSLQLSESFARAHNVWLSTFPPWLKPCTLIRSTHPRLQAYGKSLDFLSFTRILHNSTIENWICVLQSSALLQNPKHEFRGCRLQEEGNGYRWISTSSMWQEILYVLRRTCKRTTAEN